MPPIYIAPMPILHQPPQQRQGVGSGGGDGGAPPPAGQQPQTPGARASFRPPWVKEAAASNSVQAAPWTLAARRDSLTRPKPPVADGPQPPPVTHNTANAAAPATAKQPPPQQQQQPPKERTVPIVREEPRPKEKVVPITREEPRPRDRTSLPASNREEPRPTPQPQHTSPRQPQPQPQILQAQNRTTQPPQQQQQQQQQQPVQNKIQQQQPPQNKAQQHQPAQPVQNKAQQQQHQPPQPAQNKAQQHQPPQPAQNKAQQHQPPQTAQNRAQQHQPPQPAQNRAQQHQPPQPVQNKAQQNQPPQPAQNKVQQQQPQSQPQPVPNKVQQQPLQNKTQQQTPPTGQPQQQQQPQQSPVRKQSKITIIPSQPRENGLSPTRPASTVATTTTTATPQPPGPPRKTSTPEQASAPPGPPTRKVSTPEQRLRQDVINAAASTKEQLRLAKEQLEHVPRLSRLQRQDSIGQEPRVRPIQLESRQRSAPPREENGPSSVATARDDLRPVAKEEPKPRERTSLPINNREEPKPRERTVQVQKEEPPAPKPREKLTLEINREPPPKPKVPWEQPNLRKVETKMDSPTKKAPPTPPIMVQLKPPAPPPPMPPPPMPKPPTQPLPPEKAAKLEALRSRPRKRPDWGAMMKDIEQGRRLRHVQCNDRSSPLIPKIKVKDKFMYESEKDTVHNQLLKEIQSGVKLKRVVTNDRSKPQLDGLRKFRRQMTIEEQIQKAEVEPDAAEPDELDDIDKVRDDLQSTKQMLALELRNKEAVERENKRLQARVLDLEAEVEKLRAQMQSGGQTPAAKRSEEQQEIKKLREQMREAQKATEELEKKYHDTAGQLDMTRAEVDDLQRKNQALEKKLAALKDNPGLVLSKQPSAKKVGAAVTNNQRPGEEDEESEYTEETETETESSEEEENAENAAALKEKRQARELRLLATKLKSYKDKEAAARNERKALREQLRREQKALRQERHKYRLLQKEVDKMAKLMKEEEDDEEDEDEEEEESETESESESESEQSEEEQSDGDLAPDAPPEKRKQNLTERAKRHENALAALKKGNFLLKANIDRLKDELFKQKEMSLTLQEDLNSVLAELG
ncbi:bromodomain-containing protein 4-like [Schistocerca piceifrons]|uniref:bromodomain-containing protein 4-like n=1 Tax=Schistocerca piceifrons TaxID=274613 RepID=UPI001F5E5EFE|nr:bromodomain-containing protein 4-like [Schistocerca piceifrons]XP_047097691.1 bromodomain-containing protein 4-like [Schistocerca piceifrons]